MSLASPQDLIYQLNDARARTCALVNHLSEEQLVGPILPTTNPLRWEIGHTAYFYEYWILRHHYKNEPILADIDQLFDSIHIPHDSRWDLNLPSVKDTVDYMKTVKDRVIDYLSNGKEDQVRDYLTQYAIFHEDMHCEAFTYTRQTLSYPVPPIPVVNSETNIPNACNGDVLIPEGSFNLGAEHNDGFVFDNEKWAHKHHVPSFKIAKTSVSNGEYAEFVRDDGYKQKKYWCDEGWKWVTKMDLSQPVYWRKSDAQNQWEIRWFDQWKEMQPRVAVINVNWYEANAYCRWAGRRLPSELEWEVAASAEPIQNGLELSDKKRKFPWGDSVPTSNLANLNGETLGPISIDDKSEGDSAFGCRQMIGNVWEWTSTKFQPYPEFTPDMYEDYSQPLFGKTYVTRGGCWATRARLIRNTWRNYYGPERNDVFTGFRTCAIDNC